MRPRSDVTAAGIVDWGLGARIAHSVAGGSDGAHGLDPVAVRATCEEALERVLDYTGLEPVTPIPPAEPVGRSEWIESNLAELRALAAPLEARAAAEISLPGPLDGIARGALGAAGGVEAGVVLGYASRRVLGQYQVSLRQQASPPRMLLVGENLSRAAREMHADRDRFLLWVAIHEQTHSVQFAAVPWLREHVAGLVARLIDTASGRVDVRALAAIARRLVSRHPRRALRDAMRGELTRALAGPEQAAILEELQATMAVIEGYAEHVMDAAASDDGDLRTMRSRMDARRARRTGLGDIIARALGMGMKLRQYELGKAWSDAVAAEAGIEGLNRVWDDPGALPSPGELEAPAEWSARVAAASAA
jgi:coenzyme F420 biosynthesis associated uncharacterized protein